MPNLLQQLVVLTQARQAMDDLARSTQRQTQTVERKTAVSRQSADQFLKSLAEVKKTYNALESARGIPAPFKSASESAKVFLREIDQVEDRLEQIETAARRANAAIPYPRTPEVEAAYATGAAYGQRIIARGEAEFAALKPQRDRRERDTLHEERMIEQDILGLNNQQANLAIRQAEHDRQRTQRLERQHQVTEAIAFVSRAMAHSDREINDRLQTRIQQANAGLNVIPLSTQTADELRMIRESRAEEARHNALREIANRAEEHSLRDQQNWWQRILQTVRDIGTASRPSMGVGVGGPSTFGPGAAPGGGGHGPFGGPPLVGGSYGRQQVEQVNQYAAASSKLHFGIFQLTSGAQDAAYAFEAMGNSTEAWSMAMRGASNNIGVMLAGAMNPMIAILGTVGLIAIPYVVKAVKDKDKSIRDSIPNLFNYTEHMRKLADESFRLKDAQEAARLSVEALMETLGTPAEKEEARRAKEERANAIQEAVPEETIKAETERLTKERMDTEKAALAEDKMLLERTRERLKTEAGAPSFIHPMGIMAGQLGMVSGVASFLGMKGLGRGAGDMQRRVSGLYAGTLGAGTSQKEMAEVDAPQTEGQIKFEEDAGHITKQQAEYARKRLEMRARERGMPDLEAQIRGRMAGEVKSKLERGEGTELLGQGEKQKLDELIRIQEIQRRKKLTPEGEIERNQLRQQELQRQLSERRHEEDRAGGLYSGDFRAKRERIEDKAGDLAIQREMDRLKREEDAMRKQLQDATPQQVEEWGRMLARGYLEEIRHGMETLSQPLRIIPLNPGRLF